MHLQKLCLRYIVPFAVNQEFDQACAQIDGQKAPVWKRVYVDQASNTKEGVTAGNEESDLYSYVRNEFLWDEQKQLWQNKMGVTWEAREIGEHVGKLRYVKDPQAVLKGARSPYIDFEIENMGLVLYRNSLGLIWYEVSIRKPLAAEELMDFQNRFKELNRSGPSVVWQVKKQVPACGVRWKKKVRGSRGREIPPEYMIPFSMGQWIAQLLEPIQPTFLPDRKNAFTSVMKASIEAAEEDVLVQGSRERLAQVNTSIRRVADKAILFTYAMFEESEQPVFVQEEHRQWAFHLTNGYKESYRYSEETGAKMIRPFSNVLWYATQEGCAYLAWPDQKNQEFFYGTLASKVRKDYFTLFLKGIYQSYSLMLYAQKIQEQLSAVTDDYLSPREERIGAALEAEVERWIGEINLFMTKSLDTRVSHIDHHNRFYRYLEEQLQIKESVNSVAAGLDALEELQRERHKKEERQRNERLNFFLNVVAVLSSILTCSSLIDLYLQIFSEGHIAWIALAATALGVTMLVWIIMQGRKRKRKKK